METTRRSFFGYVAAAFFASPFGPDGIVQKIPGSSIHISFLGEGRAAAEMGCSGDVTLWAEFGKSMSLPKTGTVRELIDEINETEDWYAEIFEIEET